ncbi:MAG: diguanylate cyclase [Thermodesulfobacteriota bacterium]|nr:diguanylate cyclase [Thermodesulfobacteriota bacterium]
METGNLFLHDIVAHNNMWVEADATLRHLFLLMQENKKGVVVVLKEGMPIGILTERDVVNLLYKGVNFDEKAQLFARKPLIVITGMRTISYALSLMVENNIRRLVVVDRDGGFLGVVTQGEVLDHLEEDFYRSTLKVKHIVDQLRDLVGGAQDDTIRAVLEKMVEHNIGAVPILENGMATGIITEKDVLNLANKDISLDHHAGRHMSSPAICATLETKLIDVVKMLGSKDIRRVVVQGAEAEAVGVITERDLVRNLEGDYNEFLERKLRYTKEVLNLLPEMLIELLDTGDEQLVVWANEKVVSVFGRQIIDRPVTDLVPWEKWRDIYPALIEQNKIEEVRFKRDHSLYEFSGFYLPLDRATEKGRIEMFLRDITEEVMLATTDPLTKIYNRRYMNEFLAKETERSRRSKKEFAVILADVDDFKRINDTYGHLSGDFVLKKIVDGMIRGTREYDIVGRYGGEEFLIIMPEIEKSAAVHVAERMRRSIETQQIELSDGERVTVTVSFGIAGFDEDGSSPEDLLIKADERLYKAKWQGKNRVVFQ